MSRFQFIHFVLHEICGKSMIRCPGGGYDVFDSCQSRGLPITYNLFPHLASHEVVHHTTLVSVCEMMNDMGVPIR